MALIETVSVNRFEAFDAGQLVGYGIITMVTELNDGNGQQTIKSIAIDNTKHVYPIQFTFSRPNGSVETIVAQPGQSIPTRTFQPVLRVDLTGWSYSMG